MRELGFDPSTGIFIFHKSWQWFDEGLAYGISQLFTPKDAADLGCSLGKYCKYLSQKGWNIDGYEGGNLKNFAVYSPIYQVDLGESLNPKSYEVVLCLEVAEHIPLEKEKIFLDNLNRFTEKYLIISWSNKVGEGSGHVNCRSLQQVEKLMRKMGFLLDKSKTQYLREKAHVKWFKRVMVYKLRR